MTRTEALVGLNLVTDIGSVRLKRLLSLFDQPENILTASAEMLISTSGIGSQIAYKIRSIKTEEIDKEFVLAKKLGLRIITLYDQDYPENLKNIPGGPIVLYIKGEIKKQDRFGIAIVGSRRASFYGLSCAEKFAFDLSAFGFTIVSGMARGVDSCAHRGALKAKASTIAVMGSGFNHIYPAENKELAEEIARQGAVISEFPIDTLPLKQNFPRRNRLISGLSLGVLVVEAAENSGALITVDFALEQGRDVFALPGKVNSWTSFGTNALIKQGAKLVSCVDDILEEIKPPIDIMSPQQIRRQDSLLPEETCSRTYPDIDRREGGANALAEARSEDDGVAEGALRRGRTTQLQVKHLPSLPTSNIGIGSKDLSNPSHLTENLAGDEVLLYNIISQRAIQMDEIVQNSNLGVAYVSDLLLKLQLKKLIKELPGRQYTTRI